MLTGCCQWGGEQWLDPQNTWETEPGYLPVGKMRSARRGTACKMEGLLFPETGLPEEQLLG